MKDRMAVACRWVVGAVFIYAGLVKLQNIPAFADSVASFEILPKLCVNLLALGLPYFEIAGGLLLISGWKVRTWAFSLLVLNIIFAIALVQALLRGLNVDCGCMGGGIPAVWKTWLSLVRDALLMGVLAWFYRYCILRQNV